MVTSYVEAFMNVGVTLGLNSEKLFEGGIFGGIERCIPIIND